MKIRDAKPSDSPVLAELYQHSVRRLGRIHYAPEQVQAWAVQGPTAERLSQLLTDGRRRLVAEAPEGSLLGFADLESDGHIHFLYCAAEAAGSGVGAALYDALESAALAEGLDRLHVEASEGARRLFEKKGFAMLGRRDFAVAGVPIHNYAMAKALRPD